MSHRYEVTMIETIKRKFVITVDLPNLEVKSASVYGAARRAAIDLVRAREKNDQYTPDLYSVGFHYIGEVNDEDTTAQRESGGEVQPSGSTSISVSGDATGTEEGNK